MRMLFIGTRAGCERYAVHAIACALSAGQQASLVAYAIQNRGSLLSRFQNHEG
jgi:hypothetical protein